MPTYEEMTSYERVMSALTLGQPDRVPVIPIDKVTNMKASSCTYRECLGHPDKYVETQVRGLKTYEVDAVHDISTAPLLAEILGATLAVYDDDPPTAEPLFAATDDLGLIQPLDPGKRKRLDFVLEVVRRLKKAVGPAIPVTGLVPAPFLLACNLRGTETMMRDLFRNQEFAKELLPVCVDCCLNYAILLIEAGADIIRLVNPVASAMLISRKHYEAFVHPYTKQMLSGFKEHGIKTIFHTCGQWDDRLDLVTEEGAEILHVDRADLSMLKKLYGDRVGLMGNVRTVETMLMGTPEKVEQESKECIHRAAAGGRYILSADCVLPRDTPPENIKALVNAAKKFGRYL